MLVKLTSVNTNNPIYIHTLNIVAIQQEKDKTLIMTSNSGIVIYVKETADSIIDIFQKALV